MNFALPGGFGYVLNEAQINVVQDVADAWEKVGHWRLSRSSTVNINFDYRIPIEIRSFSQNGTTIGVWGTIIPSGTLTRTPIIPGSAATTQSWAFANLAAPAGAAGTIDSLVSFWEYDLEQIVNYPVHSALNVVGR